MLARTGGYSNLGEGSTTVTSCEANGFHANGPLADGRLRMVIPLPFTAFHPVPVWLLWMKFPRRLDFVAMTVGSVIPDLLEVPSILGMLGADWTQPQRDWTHSLVGALTFDAVLSLAALFLVVRPLLTWMNRRWPSGLWNHFAGHEFPIRTAWTVTLASVWIGALSHVLIDLPLHAVLRLFFPLYPAAGEYVWVFHWTLQPFVDIVANVIFAPAFVFLAYVYWWRPHRQTVEAGELRSRAN